MAEKKSMAEEMGIESWDVMTLDGKRMREGISKMREALAADARKESERGSALPSDWRSRIIRV